MDGRWRALEDATTYLLYNAALALASPLLAAGIGVRVLRGKSREGWSERCGRIALPPGMDGRRRLWVHAASVGEVMAATPVLRAYREIAPGDAIALSVITPGGREVAAGMLGKEIDALFYCPFDVPPAVRGALRTVRPHALVVVETELWPNLLHLARGCGARVALINGRISDRSLPRYRRVRGLFRWVLSALDRVLAQSPVDADRLRQIGAPADRIAVLGNAKFDQAPPRLTPDETRALRADLRLPEGAPVLVVGSTRIAEEERMVLDAYRRACDTLPDLAIVIAPRHVDRAAEVATAMRGAGLDPVRRTAMGAETGPVRHLVLDTFGELARVYAAGDVAFTGNSLLAPGGGQNPLQPLAQGKPVLHGPYVSNFRDISAQAGAARVARCVRDAGEFAAAVVELVGSPEERAGIAERAVALVDASRGASARYAREIAQLMDAGSPR